MTESDIVYKMLKCYTKKDSKGFTTHDHTMIYFIRCCNDSEEFYKIGITKHLDVIRRFKYSASLPYKFELLAELHTTRNRGRQLERLLHKAHAEYSYLPNLKFGGWKECFSYIHLDKL